MPTTEQKPAIDWQAVKTKRAAALATLEELKVTEKAAIAMAAVYLAGRETKAFLEGLAEFEEISQPDSPFAQQLRNTRNTVQHLQFLVADAARMLEQQQLQQDPPMQPAIPLPAAPAG